MLQAAFPGASVAYYVAVDALYSCAGEDGLPLPEKGIGLICRGVCGPNCGVSAANDVDVSVQRSVTLYFAAVAYFSFETVLRPECPQSRASCDKLHVRRRHHSRGGIVCHHRSAPVIAGLTGNLHGAHPHHGPFQGTVAYLALDILGDALLPRGCLRCRSSGGRGKRCSQCYFSESSIHITKVAKILHK